MIWTVPNILTIARVIAAPCVALSFAVFERPFADWLAFVLFTGAAFTDFVDGWYARKFNASSAFGKMLDPIADKAMVIISLFSLAVLYGVNWWFAIPATVILLREVLVSGLREYLGSIKLDVTKLAKWKTTAQMMAIAGLFLAAGWNTYFDIAQISMGLLWIAAALTLITGWDYFQKGMRYIREAEVTS
ncbi:UNVERIFIED_CONTAM: hypothetical protein GTU68_016817 [Idotea baltica]|nr:hypothetical protein [Idotea baltica]